MKLQRAAIVLLFTFLVSSAGAQTPKWTLVNSSSFTDQFNSMIWSSEDTGFFLGSKLEITRTIDSGTSLTVLKFPNPTDSIHRDTVTYDTVKKDSVHHPYVVLNHASAIQGVADMAWPTQMMGVIAGITGKDTFGHVARPTVLITHDAGQTWIQYYPSVFDTVIVPADTIIDSTVHPPRTTIIPSYKILSP